jgi:hypothetical protein
MNIFATGRQGAVLSFLLCVLGAATMAHAARVGRSQEQPPPTSVAYAVRVNRAPRLDGTLEDPLWEKAKPITDFREREPDQGDRPTEKSTVRILYTQKEIYFGIFCQDNDPQGIVATDLNRDTSLELDDYFMITIDPTLSRRDAYDFEFNPLGTQYDGLIVDEGHTNPGWNGIWTSSARITSRGWTATVGIPFFTLNLDRSGNMIWGVNFMRFIRRKNEEDVWSAWQREYGVYKISQEGELLGLRRLNGGRLLVVKPYVLGGFRHLPQYASGSTLGQPGMNPRDTGGLDVMLGLRSNVVANFTANTDFATAGVDTTQFNLSPYPLYYPERRQFFLENAGVFDFPLNLGHDRLFFSRQIGIDADTGDEVPVNGGAKVTGTLDGFDFGAMDVQTRAKGPDPWANFGVVRLKRSLFGGSYVGVMGIDKRSGSPTDSYNQSGGVDTRLIFNGNIDVTAFAAATNSPGLAGQNADVGGGLHYRNDWLQLMADTRRVGANFNPEVGFVNRTDCYCNFIGTSFRPRPHIRGLREMDIGGSFENDQSTAGELQTQDWDTNFQLRFNNGSTFGLTLASATEQQITDAFDLYKNIEIQPGLYSWMRHRIYFKSAQDSPLIWHVSDAFGGYYDGNLNQAGAGVNYRAGEHWTFGLVQQWNRFRLPEGNFSVALGGTSINYAFSRFFSVSSLLQLNTAHTQAASANVALRWHYRVDSDLYVIYTAGPRFASIEGNSTAINQNEFVVKLTYSFNPCIHCSRGSSGRHSQLASVQAQRTVAWLNAVDPSRTVALRAGLAGSSGGGK